MKYFTFTIDDLRNIRNLLDMYVEINPDFANYPPIDTTPYRITIKAPQLYGLFNGDAIVEFHRREGGYDAHYETANAVLMDVIGSQKPFDFQVITSQNIDKGYKAKCDIYDCQMFLESNYKFGVKQSNATVFMTSLSCAQFTSILLTFLYDIRDNGTNQYYKLIPNYYEIGKKILAEYRLQKRKETLLDGWDVVSLTQNQYYKIVDTLCDRKYEYDVLNIPLRRFCLSLYDGKDTFYYFYELKGQNLRCGVTDPKTFVTKYFTVKLGDTEFDNTAIHASLVAEGIETDLLTFLMDKTKGNDDENWIWQANTFHVINTFMLHFGDVTMDVETKQAVARSEKQSKKHNHHRNSVRLFKTYKLVRNWKTQARKKAEIKCTCWGVRGHLRHYKNGKTIFIEPFMKGKERDKYVGKEYNLLPYKDA